MASTTAMFTALTGLNANARNLDVIGNNIANVNTTAFKSSRMLFSTMMSRTMHEGSAPSDASGGTNPFQIGLGVKIAGTQRDMATGTLSVTGDPRDLSIDGGGFFMVRRADQELFTRAGGFRQNADNYLTTIDGDMLRGYSVDDEFNIDPGTLTDIRLPLGQLTIAEATRNVRLAGNLDGDGPLPTSGSRINLGASATTGFRAITTAAPPPALGNVLESTTRLVDIEDPLQPGSDAPGFAMGQQVQLHNAQKGNKLLPEAALAITGTTTVQELMDFLAAAMGIDTTSGPNPDSRTPSVTVDPTSGFITLDGNTGEQNDLVVDSADLRLLDAGGLVVGYPFTPDKLSTADGESVRTTMIVYDSLGTPVEVDVTMGLESRGAGGSTWRYWVESDDAATIALQVGTGTISFDTEGQLVTNTPATMSIDRTGTGAVSPLTFELAFGGGDDTLTALTDDESSLAAVFRDGSPIGTLAAFAVGPDGIISGAFSNGLTRTLGQVVLANFTNPEGLAERGNNLFAVGANSGPPQIVTPGTFGSGRVVGGSLELSNVDIGEEFVKMILSSTGYSANSRVIRTVDELMQQLLVMGR